MAQCKTRAEFQKLCPPFEAHSKVVTSSLGALFKIPVIDLLPDPQKLDGILVSQPFLNERQPLVDIPHPVCQGDVITFILLVIGNLGPKDTDFTHCANLPLMTQKLVNRDWLLIMATEERNGVRYFFGYGLPEDDDFQSRIESAEIGRLPRSARNDMSADDNQLSVVSSRQDRISYDLRPGFVRVVRG